MESDIIAKIKDTPVESLADEIAFKDYMIEELEKLLKHYKWEVEVLLRQLAKELKVDLNTLDIP